MQQETWGPFLVKAQTLIIAGIQYNCELTSLSYEGLLPVAA